MAVAQYGIQQFLVFLLVVFRLSGLMIFAPVWGSRNILDQWKIAFALVVASLVAPLVPSPPSLPRDLLPLGLLAVKELGVGLVLGYAASLLFTGVQLAGQMASQQMGQGLANIMDPFTETESSVIGEFQFFLAVVIFLAINGHHMLLRAVTGSFDRIPLGGMVLNVTATREIVRLFGDVFVIAIRISAPVVVALFVTTVALGFVARTVPQVNILVIGFPVQIVVGFVVLGVSTAYLAEPLVDMFRDQFRMIEGMVRMMAPGSGAP
ncbi:MAG: flagellar biosynthetic protein FliR [Planctomycetota bacterium]